MSVAAAIQTDYSEGEAVVGTDDLTIAFCRSRHCQAGGTDGEGI
jgi:hypothetical protein